MTVRAMGGITDVQPPRIVILFADDGLTDELVEIGVVTDELEILLRLLTRRDVDIGSLTTEVLRARRPTDEAVDLPTAVAAGDDYLAVAQTEWFEDGATERAEVLDDLRCRRVVDTKAECRS